MPNGYKDRINQIYPLLYPPSHRLSPPMKTCTLLLSLFLAMLSGPAVAQKPASWQDFWTQADQPEDTNPEAWQQATEELGDLAARPIDLNRCTREDLRQLPFLSEQQVMDLMEYRHRVHRIESTMELRLVPSLNAACIDLLLPFVTIAPETPRDTLPSLKTLARLSRHELVGTFTLPLYSRRGDQSGYLGPRYKHWLRYTLTAGPQLRAGIVASQDAGEPFFAGKNAAGYDFYSFYVVLRRMGRLKALALGRYRLRFGMGLVLNNSLSLGKLNTLSTLGRWGSPITGHGSRSEGRYQQGAAATVELAKGWELTAFASWRKVDATLNADSSTVATLLTGGYHRTPGEMKRRRNTTQTLLGTHLDWRANGFHVGATALHVGFDRDLRPNREQIFRRWYPEGKSFANVAVDYGYLSSRLHIAGETAVDNNGSVATINSASYRLTGSLTLMALQRYYPYRFTAIFGESMAEGGTVNNESGLCLGGSWAPLRGMALTFYTDYAYFAWPKYQASASSACLDHFVQMGYTHRQWALTARYRLRRRQYDNTDKSALEWRSEHRCRLAASHNGRRWTCHAQADASWSCRHTTSFGYMLSGHVGYGAGRMQLRASLGYFHTDDYASRLYLYERGPLYTLSFPAYYGHGMRYALFAHAGLARHAMVVAKMGVTNYFDRSTIGTALQQVDGSSTADLEVQLRLTI